MGILNAIGPLNNHRASAWRADRAGADRATLAFLCEAGTPFWITVDGQKLQDKTVTVRDRDTLEQIRVKADDVVEEIARRVEG